MPGACCKMNPFHKDFWDRMKARALRTPIEVKPLPDDQVLVITGNRYCCFLTAGKRCVIWDDRPTVCRVWGPHDAGPCRYPDDKKGPVKERNAMISGYIRADSLGQFTNRTTIRAKENPRETGPEDGSRK